jgi:hypothetical protein
MLQQKQLVVLENAKTPGLPPGVLVINGDLK